MTANSARAFAMTFPFGRPSGKGCGFDAASIRDCGGKMELVRHFRDAAVELDPNAARMDEGVRFPLCRPEALMEVFASGGLPGAEVTPIDVATPFAGFEDCWQPFLGGQRPAPACAMSLGEAARARLRDRMRERMPVQADGSISLTAPAWVIRATCAK